uniref:Uncharacterized protein n=1 Tax=Cacopsylla melanoneura TaxID=428564 RepID=A0A8D8YKZ8_9HEMI
MNLTLTFMKRRFYLYVLRNSKERKKLYFSNCHYATYFSNYHYAFYFFICLDATIFLIAIMTLFLFFVRRSYLTAVLNRLFAFLQIGITITDRDYHLFFYFDFFLNNRK